MPHHSRFATVATATFGIIAAFAADLGPDNVPPLQYGAGPASWRGDLTPIGPADWSYERAGHLLERAGFGGTPAAIDKLAAMTPEEAVAYFVNYESIGNDHLPPFDESGIWSESMLPDINDNIEFGEGIRRATERGEVYGVKPNSGGVRPMQPVIDMLYYRNYASRHEWERAMIWWADRMLNTRRPLEEKMTLFWHDHFATEQEKVRDYRLLLNQIDTLRRGATGNFRDLLISVAQDPAMLVYLDNRKNVKGHANENFAREIMELFALGVGNYTEDDIKEAARAFTGWTHYGTRFINNREMHDSGIKTILGETGNFDGVGVIDIILRQKACAEFIAGKIYRDFVSEELTPELQGQLAAILRDNNYEIKPLLTAIFLSRDFYAPHAYGTQIKSPVHLLVSTCAKLGVKKIPGTPYFPYVSTLLGQALGNPPNVAGWDGGRAWINPSTLVERGNVMRHLLFPREAAGLYDLGPFAGRYDRYLNAHVEVLERDRQAVIGAPIANQGESMEGGMDSNMMAPSANMINETPAYDLPYGVYNGKTRAFATVKPPDQSPAEFSLSAALSEAGIRTPAGAVLCLERMLLRVPLREDTREVLAAFLRDRIGADAIDFANPSIEAFLRETAHLIMSSPEFQMA